MSDAPDLRPILIAPDPALRCKARAVGPADMAGLRALLPAMFATMYHAPGIGLAAPQIGVSLRVVVIDLGEEGDRRPLVLINPEILARSEQLAAREEGCLSLPGQYAEIVRPASVRVRYLDGEGQAHEAEADDLLATCIQHEIDHLDGVLFVDHLSALKRNMLLRRLAKDQRQKNERG